MNTRIRELDGLRAFAVLAVLGYHVGVPWLRGGFVGLDIFFVISGYIITTLLLKERDQKGRIKLGAFYWRRVLRLLPALALAVVLIALCCAFVFPGEEASQTVRAFPFVAFYATNWVIALGHPTGLNANYWSLAIEEQFYILWPLALISLMRSKLSRSLIAKGLLGLSVLIGVYRGLLWSVFHDAARAGVGTDVRFDGLVLGCALAFWVSAHPVTSHPRGLQIAAWASLGVLVVYIVGVQGNGDFVFDGGISLACVCSALIVWAAVAAPAISLTAILGNRLAVYIGAISYGIYVYQAVVLAVVANWTLVPALHYGLDLGVPLLVAAVSFRYVERQFLQLKDRGRLGLRKGRPGGRFVAIMQAVRL